jgi:hypothetical protein
MTGPESIYEQSEDGVWRKPGTAAPMLKESHAAEETDTALLLGDIAAFVRRYVVLDQHQADAVALWIAHTHALDAAELSPYLAISSAEMRSGKSTLLDLLALLASRPWQVITPSEAVVFRKVDRDRPTLLLDEYDAIFSQKEQEPLRALLNAGNRPRTTVPRCAGANRDEIKDFSIFCAKALAGIGKLPPTVADRSIEIRMKRKAPTEAVERSRWRELEKRAEPIHQSLRGWADHYTDDLTIARPEIPEELNDRAADGWEPLLAIADLAGGPGPSKPAPPLWFFPPMSWKRHLSESSSSPTSGKCSRAGKRTTSTPPT